MKKFKTFDELFEHLTLNKNANDIEFNSKKHLVKYGYYDNVNSYKFLYHNGKIEGNHTYKRKFSLSEVEFIYHFENKFSQIIFSNISNAEKTLSNIVSYLFALNNGAYNYLNVSEYNDYTKKAKDKNYLVKEFKNYLNTNNNSYLVHYKDKHDEIPIWILMKTLNFSDLQLFYYFQKNSIQVTICDFYNVKNKKSKIEYNIIFNHFESFRHLRNKIAHNEKIVNFETNFGADTAHIIANNFFLNKGRGKVNKIRDILIMLSHYIDKEEYNLMCLEIETLFEELKIDITNLTFQKLLSSFGFKDFKEMKNLKSLQIEFNYDFILKNKQD